MKLMTRSLVRHAHAIAREVGARVILLAADVVEADADLAALIQDVDFRVILVSRRNGFQPPEGWADLCAVVRIPDIALTRAGQILMEKTFLSFQVFGIVALLYFAICYPLSRLALYSERRLKLGG